MLSFDLNVDGQPGHLLTMQGNGEMDAALLQALITDLLGPRWAFCCSDAAHVLAVSRGADAWRAYDQLSAFLEDAEPEEARRRTLEVAQSMTRSYVLWVPVMGRPGDRQVAHFSYEIGYEKSSSVRIRTLRTLSWGGGDEYLQVPHVGQSGSYHIDVQAPDGLYVMDTSVYFVYGRPEHGESVPEAPEANVQQIGERAHIYTAGRRPGTALIRVRMMPRWRGFIGASWMTALGIAGLLTAFWRWSAAMTQDPTSSVAILVIVPAVLGAITLRPSVHPKTLDRLFGVQLLLFASGSLSVFSALVGVRFEKQLEPTRALWRDAAYGSYVVLIMISISLLVALLAERKLHRADDDD
ncbi:MAG: hypothetical protein ACLP50_06700 [Solirubrobacteraceae bacterium]